MAALSLTKYVYLVAGASTDAAVLLAGKLWIRITGMQTFPYFNTWLKV